MIQKLKLLFLCNYGINRSPLAASLFDNSPYYEARSAGFYPLKIGRESGKPITEELVNWADQIFVMTDDQDKALKDRFDIGDKKIKVLDVPDVYNTNLAKDYEKLKNILIEKLKDYLKDKI